VIIAGSSVFSVSLSNASEGEKKQTKNKLKRESKRKSSKKAKTSKNPKRKKKQFFRLLHRMGIVVPGLMRRCRA